MKNENISILTIALDAANSGDTEAAMMYADMLRKSVVNGFNVAVTRAHTMIMSAIESSESREKFARFDAFAQRASYVHADILRMRENNRWNYERFNS